MLNHSNFLMRFFFFHVGVTAEYGNNELLFVYKNLIGNRNESVEIRVFEGRRSGGISDSLKR